MAGIAMLIGGAVVNGLAFTGSGYLFKMLDKNGYETEMKRHNLAQEKLQNASIQWEEQRKATIDFVNLQLKKEHEATFDFNNVDSALIMYNHVYPHNKVEISNPPKLTDYYVPSEERKNYEYLWIISGMIGIGFLTKILLNGKKKD